MTDSESPAGRRDDVALARLASDLAQSLRDLQRELEPRRRRPRPPSPRRLLRFTDEVAIPAAILVLETNVRALELLQRTIRLTEPSDRTATRAGETALSERAVRLGESSLARLDDALADVEAALDGRPPDDEARRLLAEARDLRAEVADRLDDTAQRGASDRDAVDVHDASGVDDTATEVPVDVDAELQSIKEDVADEHDDGDESTG